MSKTHKPELIVCIECDSEYPSSKRRCPKCGTPA